MFLLALCIALCLPPSVQTWQYINLPSSPTSDFNQLCVFIHFSFQFRTTLFALLSFCLFLNYYLCRYNRGRPLIQYSHQPQKVSFALDRYSVFFLLGRHFGMSVEKYLELYLRLALPKIFNESGPVM